MSAPYVSKAALAHFDTWVDLSDGERPAWLAALKVSEPEVHQRLLSLIDADQVATRSPFLSPPAVIGDLTGKTFGPWRVEKLIGTGGMAQVWLARRTDGLYDGLAAIKLLRLASADRSANERFAREGRLLGRLSDPNIARLLDAGVTAAGERFLVLEYVDGERIDTWCNRNKLTLAARIELFIVVCKAVAHAHENLIVHRDLKPSNIFVTADGEVKLLDFGVGKLVADDADALALHTQLTREAGVAMTPAYAAPEQIAGQTVSTSMDVYALGMVLYELLNGARPMQPMHPGEVPKPLWTLTTTPEETVRLADQRSTSAKDLRRALRGDMAAVVAKAVKPDPELRYRSAMELADDLQRLLDRRPVRARPDTVLYRAGLAARRHALALTMVTVVFLSIVAGVTGTVVNARAAAREGDRAVAVKSFLLDLFEQARGSVRGGVEARAATLDDVLNAGAQRIENAFAAQPDIRDEVFQILIELYTDTGTREQIVALARRRVAAAKAAFGPDDPRLAPSEVMLGAVQINFGVYDEAKTLLADAQRLLDKAGDKTSIERARLLRWQGLLALATQQQIPWDEHPLRRGIQLMNARYAGTDDLLAALSDLPTVACQYGRADEAMAGANELYERTVVRYGKDNLFASEATAQRARILQLTNRPTEAIPLWEESLAGMHKYVGEESPNIVAVLSHLAESYEAVGRTDDAQRTLEDMHSAAERHPGNAHVDALIARAQATIEKIKAGQTPHCGA